MKNIMAKLQRFGRIRQLHTIISKETIKPSTPTPPNFKTHNLSLLDQFAPDMHTPAIFFFKNFRNGDANILKQSLSQSLTQYYPFAGRIPTPFLPYIDCNDEGVEFLEAYNDSPLEDFIHKDEQNENLDQLFPYGLSNTTRLSCPKLLDVQLNHFVGGGAALAVSMSHKIADGTTIFNFIKHWASVAHFESPVNPSLISSSSDNDMALPKFVLKNSDTVYATKIFTFPNVKINELKKNVISTSRSPTNPSRVEVLTSLIFKHAVSAASTKAGSLKPSHLSSAINMRNKFVDQKYPETTIGNLFTLAIANMDEYSADMRLSEVVSEVRKAKKELEGVRDMQDAIQKLLNKFSTLRGDIYYTSSVCRVPFYEVDFGWGKPIDVIIRIPNVDDHSMVLMDTPSGDGISAHVHLPEEEMTILQKDNEFVTYLQDT